VAEAGLSEDRKDLVIRLAARRQLFGDRAAGSPFTAYARGVGGDLEVRQYAVSAGEALEDSWSVADFLEGRYDVAVHGPNGFYRRFQGAASDPPIGISMSPIQAAHDGDGAGVNVAFEITNYDDRAHAVTLTDRAYGQGTHSVTLARGETKAVGFATSPSHGWYDVRIQISGVEGFHKTYAGKIETGAASITDPAMA
jgi:phospholipase C